jgi:hypothetical protein
MWQTSVEVRARRSPEAVFAFVAEGFFANHPRWDPAIEIEDASPGPIGTGSTAVEVRRFAGRMQRAAFEITEFEPPRRFAFRNTSGPFDLDRAYTFEPVWGDATEIRFVFRIAPRAFPFTVLFPLIRGTIARQVRANIHRLRDLLEDAA